MKKTRSKTRGSTQNESAVTAEGIARMADKGEDVSRFFTNAGRMMAPVQRVNVDFTASMLEELDREAKELNISRQAVIKTLLRRALDEQYVAAAARPGVKERERAGVRQRWCGGRFVVTWKKAISAAPCGLRSGLRQRGAHPSR